MATNNNFGAIGLSRPMRGFERRVPDDTAATAPARPRPTVAAPLASEQPTSTPIGTQHQRISDALDKFEDEVARILNAEQSGAITPEGRSQMVHDVARPALDAISQAEAATADLADAADDAFKKTRAALSPRAANATDALNHTLWWQRTSRKLDSVPAEKVAAVCQRLIADARPDELAWAATELPSYLRSLHIPSDWIDTALHQVHPELRTAAERRRLSRQAADIINSNARSARKALASAASGSYRRPKMVDPTRYDPDVIAESGRY
jgi:hypothetical protein